MNVWKILTITTNAHKNICPGSFFIFSKPQFSLNYLFIFGALKLNTGPFGVRKATDYLLKLSGSQTFI